MLIVAHLPSTGASEARQACRNCLPANRHAVILPPAARGARCVSRRPKSAIWNLDDAGDGGGDTVLGAACQWGSGNRRYDRRLHYPMSAFHCVPNWPLWRREPRGLGQVLACTGPVTWPQWRGCEHARP